MCIRDRFRDYLYIPLGGNKGGKFRWHLNTIIVFTLSGLWHGANWPLVAWGALNGLFIVISRQTANMRGFVREKTFGALAKAHPAVYFALFAVGAAAAGLGDKIGMGLGGRIGAGAAALALLPVAVLSTRKELFPRFLEGLKKAVMIIITYHLFVFGGIYFKVRTMADGWYMLTHFWGTNFIQLPLFFGLEEFGFMLLLVIFLCSVNYIQERRGSIREMLRKKPLVVRWALYYLMVMSIFAGMLKTAQFIYFQF